VGVQQENTTAINAAKSFMTRGVYFYDFFIIRSKMKNWKSFVTLLTIYLFSLKNNFHPQFSEDKP